MENACTKSKLTKVDRSVRLFKIDGFSFTSSMSKDDCIKSRWNADGFEWEISIYPATVRMFEHYAKPSVAVEFRFLSEIGTSTVRTKQCCQLLDPTTGKLSPDNTDSLTLNGPYNPGNSIKMFLLDRHELEPKGYIKDDSLTVQCTITVFKELPVPDIITTPVRVVPVPSSDLYQHFAELLRSEKGSDITFVVSGESFAAHKLILAARSPVFMVEFFGDMKEKCSQHVEIKDMEVAVFKALLHFIYTDTVPEFEEQQEHFIYTDTVSEFDEQQESVTVMAQHLLAAADRYGLERLKLICEGKLSGGIDVDTAATTLALAEQHNCPELKAACVDFIISTPEVLNAVLATEGYKHLETSCPLVVIDVLKSALGRRN